MALSIIWSAQALDDIAAIAAFIERDSPFYARVVAQKIIQAAENAAQFPHAGRVVPERNQTKIRENFVYSYRIMYAVGEANIEILTVIHGKRLLQVPTEPPAA